MRTLTVLVAIGWITLYCAVSAQTPTSPAAVDEAKPAGKSVGRATYGDDTRSLGSQFEAIGVPSAAMRSSPTMAVATPDAISNRINVAAVTPARISSGIAPRSKLTTSRATVESGVKPFDPSAANLESGQTGGLQAAGVRSLARVITPARNGATTGRAMLTLATTNTAVAPNDKARANAAASVPIARPTIVNRLAARRDIPANVNRPGAKPERLRR
jgi:hypothetical protein